MTSTFDRDELLEELDGDREFLEESLEMMEADGPKLLGEIRDAIAANDAETVSRSAHTLKSMVGNFCAPPAHEAALKVEMAGRDGDLAECTAAHATLEQEVARLQKALREFLEEIE